MCSLIEAWGDNDFPQMTGRVSLPSATEASMNGIRNNQIAMDEQRGSGINAIRAMSIYPAANQVGQPVSWADNRRQYAQPANEIMNINGGYPGNDNNLGGGWQTAYCKPRQDMNSMTRGVHSKYSREKRFDSRTAELPFGGQITTDVDPAMITGDANGRPGYLDLYSTGYEGRKWLPNMTAPTTTQAPRIGDGRPEAGINPATPLATIGLPIAANDAPEKFMEITDNDLPGNKSAFTQEVITDPRLIAENLAARAEQLKQISNRDNNNHLNNNANGTSVIIPDEIRNIQVQLNALVGKMNNLEQKVSYVENNKSHDIILFIVIAIFILFVLDNVFKLGKLS